MIRVRTAIIPKSPTCDFGSYAIETELVLELGDDGIRDDAPSETADAIEQAAKGLGMSIYPSTGKASISKLFRVARKLTMKEFKAFKKAMDSLPAEALVAGQDFSEVNEKLAENRRA